MSIRYRLKRSSGPVNKPIPAHPDAIFNSQNRPIPVNTLKVAPDIIVPPMIDTNAVASASLMAGGNSFSPWWIIGPLLALLAAMAIGALAYTTKKKYDSKKQIDRENTDTDDRSKRLPVENIPLRSIKPNTMSKEQTSAMPISSASKTLRESKDGPSNDELESKSTKSKSDVNVHKKENTSPLNDPNQTDGSKSDRHKPSKTEQDQKEFPSLYSPGEISDSDATNTLNDRDMRGLNSPVQHGVGKSPFISSMPTGAKRHEREKLPNENDQIEETKSISKTSTSNSNVLSQLSSTQNIDSKKSENPSSLSNMNKDKQPSTLTLDAKHKSLSETSKTSLSQTLKEKISNFSNQTDQSNQNLVPSSDEYTKIDKNNFNKFGKELEPHIDSLSDKTMRKSSNDDKSDESTTSLPQPGVPNRSKLLNLLPNVPQCKGNASSDDDDDDYDQIYPVSQASQQTPSKRQKKDEQKYNLNINASTYRTRRTLFMNKTRKKHFK